MRLMYQAPSGNGDGLSSDVARFIRRQERHQRSNIIGRAEARSQHVTRDHFLQARHRPLKRLSHDYARSEEHTSELHSLMRISYAVFCLKKKKTNINIKN